MMTAYLTFIDNEKPVEAAQIVTEIANEVLADDTPLPHIIKMSNAVVVIPLAGVPEGEIIEILDRVEQACPFMDEGIPSERTLHNVSTSVDLMDFLSRVQTLALQHATDSIERKDEKSRAYSVQIKDEAHMLMNAVAEHVNEPGKYPVPQGARDFLLDFLDDAYQCAEGYKVEAGTMDPEDAAEHRKWCHKVQFNANAIRDYLTGGVDLLERAKLYKDGADVREATPTTLFHERYTVEAVRCDDHRFNWFAFAWGCKVRAGKSDDTIIVSYGEMSYGKPEHDLAVRLDDWLVNYTNHNGPSFAVFTDKEFRKHFVAAPLNAEPHTSRPPAKMVPLLG